MTTAQNIAIGDSVFLLKRGKVPYLLQNIPFEKETFRLIGDAYIHGHMHGGDWDPKRCKKIYLV
jgi:hypothetical protein